MRVINSIHNTKESTRYDRCLIQFICVVFLCMAMNNLLNTVFRQSTDISTVTNYLIKAILIISLLIAISSVIRSKGMRQLLIVEVLGVFVYLISFIMGNASNSLLVDYAFWTLVICIAAGLFAYLIQNRHELIRNIYILSWILTITLLPIAFLNRDNPLSGAYSMFLGYKLLLPATVFLQSYFDHRRVVDLLRPLYAVLFCLPTGTGGVLFLWRRYRASCSF